MTETPKPAEAPTCWCGSKLYKSICGHHGDGYGAPKNLDAAMAAYRNLQARIAELEDDNVRYFKRIAELENPAETPEKRKNQRRARNESLTTQNRFYHPQRGLTCPDKRQADRRRSQLETPADVVDQTAPAQRSRTLGQRGRIV